MAKVAGVYAPDGSQYVTIVDGAGNVVSAGQSAGTTTNDNASAGNIGEYIESAIASPGISLTSGTAANLTSIPLTAGDWDVCLNGCFITGAATNITQTLVSLSSTSATIDGNPGKFALQNYTPTVFGAVNQSEILQDCRVPLSAPATLYFVVRAFFTISTLTVFGLIRARRVR